MQTVQVAIPKELLQILDGSPLGARPPADQVRLALAIQLFQQGQISMGEAAELVGVPQIVLEVLISDLGLPIAFYDLEDDAVGRQGIRRAVGEPSE